MADPSFAYVWNSAFLSQPQDTEDESLGAQRIRETKAAVGERLAVNHSLAGDQNDGKHLLCDFIVQTVDPSLDATDGGLYVKVDSASVTQLFYIDSNGQVIQLTSGGAINLGNSVIPSGTRMAFLQTAVPTGWTQDTSLNDQVIRLNNGTGGGTGGSWTLSGITIGNTVLTVDQLPSHDHTGNIAFTQRGSGGDSNPVYGPGSGFTAPFTTASTGSGNPHTHTFTNDGAWRPAYVDAVVGVKN
jgi:hypothetical protein